MLMNVHPGRTWIGGRLTDDWRCSFDYAEPGFPGWQDVHVALIRSDSCVPRYDGIFRIPINAGAEWYNDINWQLWDWARRN